MKDHNNETLFDDKDVHPYLSEISDAEIKALDPISEMEISKAVEIILTDQNEQIQSTFYRNIDTSEEFGISRFVADRVYYLPKLLENITLSFIQNSTYLVSAEVKDPGGGAIKLEHRFKATNDIEAGKIYDKTYHQLAGIQLKIWLACWRLGDELRRYSYTCQLTALMRIVHPARKGYFSVSERTEFFEHLKSLEQTKLIFSRPNPGTKRKKELYQTYEIPLLQIISRIGGEDDKYPQQITLSIMNLFPHPGKMAFLGTAFKLKTLELHADDTQLATWIQTRKGQRPDEKFITVERDFLIKLSRLQRTDATNKTVANKKLILKLQRLASTGVIKDAPTRLFKEVKLQVR